MSPLWVAYLLGCATLTTATVFRRQNISEPFEGSELSRLTAHSNVHCGAACQRAGTSCQAFRYSNSSCTLLSEPSSGYEGTFERLPSPPPTGYTACGTTAYRILPPMLRVLAVAACAEDGGRMAVPLALQQRQCIQDLLLAASMEPGFDPATLTLTDTAYVGMTVTGSGADSEVTDLTGAPLEVPAGAWAPGEPDGALLSLPMSVVLSGTLFRDWAIDSDLLMNVCEVSLLEEP
ncbi:hypothetical protein FJT64_002869 [Amphibalanus amphitrite]|uniref:Apple domain-containing protein n=1 Tax=Amphibalanus amphitrite TaxID=1232801 RepID=A0A6A4WEN6_AMPAM|nr:hypothetical protein FJT64_002869 [Amphibalanus amphitrite]